jgi:hypothetical protein
MAQTYRDITKPWYGLARWKKRRAEQLKREPMCWMCLKEGRATPAAVADHDPPHRGDPVIFWTGKLRSLCKRHHDSDKARIEAGGKAVTPIGVDGWPIEGGEP